MVVNVVAILLLVVVLYIKYVEKDHDPMWPAIGSLIILGVRFPEFGWFMLRIVLIALAEAE